MRISFFFNVLSGLARRIALARQPVRFGAEPAPLAAPKLGPHGGPAPDRRRASWWVLKVFRRFSEPIGANGPALSPIGANGADPARSRARERSSTPASQCQAIRTAPMGLPTACPSTTPRRRRHETPRQKVNPRNSRRAGEAQPRAVAGAARTCARARVSDCSRPTELCILCI
jgi:hypothetical protein